MLIWKIKLNSLKDRLMRIKMNNIFSENIYPDWEVDEKKFIDIAKKILDFYLSEKIKILLLQFLLEGFLPIS